MSYLFEMVQINCQFLILPNSHRIQKGFEAFSVSLEIYQFLIYLLLGCCFCFEKHLCQRNAYMKIVNLIFLLNISDSNRVQYIL